MTSQGRPDCPRSARYILKDYVNVGNKYNCISIETSTVIAIENAEEMTLALS